MVIEPISRQNPARVGTFSSKPDLGLGTKSAGKKSGNTEFEHEDEKFVSCAIILYGFVGCETWNFSSQSLR